MHSNLIIPTIKIVARTVRHIDNVDPLKLIKTKEDFMSFPSIDCTLHTTKLEDVQSGNCVFIILFSNNGDEKPYVIYLGKDQDNSRKCLGHDPIKAWDAEAQLVRH